MLDFSASPCRWERGWKVVRAELQADGRIYKSVCSTEPSASGRSVNACAQLGAQVNECNARPNKTVAHYLCTA